MTRGRPKSRLNEIIDREITTMFELNGAALAPDIYAVLIDHHSEAVQAELEEDARRGLMRRIEHRLKQFSDAAEEDDRQLGLPGIPPDLQRRMGRVITMEYDAGDGQRRCSYHDLTHPNTTVRHVAAHLKLLREQYGNLALKIEAFVEALNRCGQVDPDTPFVTALQTGIARA